MHFTTKKIKKRASKVDLIICRKESTHIKIHYWKLTRLRNSKNKKKNEKEW